MNTTQQLSSSRLREEVKLPPVAPRCHNWPPIQVSCAQCILDMLLCKLIENIVSRLLTILRTTLKITSSVLYNVERFVKVISLPVEHHLCNGAFLISFLQVLCFVHMAFLASSPNFLARCCLTTCI